jgi:predicted metal-dependent hydrolase
MFNLTTSDFIHEYRPKNRNTYITVTKEGVVVIRSAYKDDKKLRTILEEKIDWINDKLEKLKIQGVKKHDLGKNILFRGEIIELERLTILHKKIKDDVNNINIIKYYHQFYKNEAILTLPSRIAYYAKKMGCEPSEIRYKRMRRRWGSCSSTGVVTFNTLMMQLTYEHIDYIIVHELAHLKHMNHSREFHGFVKSILSNEKQLRQELKNIDIDCGGNLA